MIFMLKQWFTAIVWRREAFGGRGGIERGNVNGVGSIQRYQSDAFVLFRADRLRLRGPPTGNFKSTSPSVDN